MPAAAPPARAAVSPLEAKLAVFALAIGAFTGASSGAAASDSAVPGAGSTGPGSAPHIARHAHHTH